MRTRFVSLVGLACCLVMLGCGSDTAEGGDDAARADADGDGAMTPAADGAAGTAGTDGAAGTGATGGTGGMSVDGAMDGGGRTDGAGGSTQPDGPFFCGDTRCTELQGWELLGDANPLEYCCSPSNLCSSRAVGANTCPEPLICSGERCVRDPITALLTSMVGTPCCSPSGQCSIQPPGQFRCPEPAQVDPECPTVVGTAGCCLPDNTCGILALGTCADVGVLGGALGTQYDCDGNPLQPPQRDAGMDAGIDAGIDAGPQPGTDAAIDAGADAAADAGKDAGMDASPDEDAGT